MLNRDRNRSLTSVVERLAGMNAQTKRGPIVGLWTRVADYRHDDYLSLLQSYELVRANLMRGTAHLVTRRQYAAWRNCLQPIAERTVTQFCRGLWTVVGHDDLLDAGRNLLGSHPGLTRAEIGAHLAPSFPGASPKDLGFAIRMLLPVVEIADTDPWRSVRTAYVLAESVLGEALADDGTADLVSSFQRAYGPSTAADVSYWSGLRIADMASDADDPVEEPPRPAFVLPEFDNVLFCRKNDPELAAAKKRLIYPPAKMYGSVVTDGTVAGHWAFERGTPVRTDWQPPNRAVEAEWREFADWSASMS
jgi:hypothetical protein